MVVMSMEKKITAEARHLLNSVKYADDNIERSNNLRQVIRSRAEKVTTTYSDMPGGGHNPDSRADTIAKLVDTERKQQEAMRQWCDAITQVQIVISWLDDYNDRSVLEHRYINCEDWITISFHLNYSVQHLYYIHGRALYRLAMLLKDKRK
jgi:hypothetical protein